MTLALISGPTTEPVTLAEAKDHCRLESSADDAIVASLITTSRLHVEAALGLALLSQRWKLTRHAWPALGTLRMPLRPVLAVDSITVADQDGTRVELDRASWFFENDPRGVSSLRPVAPGRWPEPGIRYGGIAIDFEAGYGRESADVPGPIRHAILMLVAHWYENREPSAVHTAAATIPSSISALLAPYKKVSL